MDHVKRLKKGELSSWNEWRSENHDMKPDLRGANLREANLRGANLRQANLSEANLRKAKLDEATILYANLRDADLTGADLRDANLRRADLRGANLRRADLRGANLREANLVRATLGRTRLFWANLNEADLSEADLSDANLNEANLSQANLSDANLTGADLSDANLTGADLSDANLTAADLSDTNLSDANLNGADLSAVRLVRVTFGNTNLSTTRGLEAVKHAGPSTIGVDTLSKSDGNLPETFLRGCGLSDWQVEAVKLYRTDVTNEEIGDILYRIHDLRAYQAIQISPLFISYSHADDGFVNQIERYFVKSGIRHWRDVHHATAGRLERQIDRAIRLNPTMLIVLSKNAVESDWVEHEVRTARKLTKEINRDVLCPVALDESWKSCNWPDRLREQLMEYNILDFSNWEDVLYFDRMYRRLIEGLNLYYKKEE